MSQVTRIDEYANAKRDARIVELRAQRVPFREIADELGISRQRVQQLWDAILIRIPAAHLDRHREEERELADDAVRDLLDIIRDPEATHGARTRAWEVACKWSERKSRLLGLDAPVRRELEITDTTGWEYQMRAAIAETERELHTARTIAITAGPDDAS
jgi:hypothetical protein